MPLRHWPFQGRVDKIASLRAFSHALPEKTQLLVAWWEMKRRVDHLFEMMEHMFLPTPLSSADG